MITQVITYIDTIEFLWPWIFSLLPLPLLVRFIFPAYSPVKEAALRVPTLTAFTTDTSISGAAVNKGRWLIRLAWLAWLLLMCATAQPVWYGQPVELPVSGRDLMLAVDLSGSMETEDFVINGRQINRLSATQKVASEFIDRRVGDRVGLILFGRQAYVQSPLTFDRETVRTLLNEAAIGLAGQETAIGDAIGLAVKRLNENADAGKVLILLTDGANTAGEIEPVKAAELAANEGLKIYTIGIGADQMIVRSLFGTRRVNPSTDLDEDTLKTIAQATRGRYFRARDVAELDKIYQLLDELEPVERERHTFRPQQAIFYYPLAIAVMLSGSLVLLRAWLR